MDLLRAMAQPGSDLLEQAPDGTLMLGSEGEKLTSHYSFYAVFETDEEYRVLCAGKDLGTLPVMGPTAKGMIIIFSARRWKIVDIHQRDKVIEVKPAKGGTPPSFGGNGPSRHRIIDEKMVEIFRSPDIPRYMDQNAIELLEEGRSSFGRYGLAQTNLIEQGDGILLFPWAGSAMISALMMIFQHNGHLVENQDYALSIKDIRISSARALIEQLAIGNVPDIEEITWSVGNKSMGQYDQYLTDTLLVQQLRSTLPTPVEFQAWAQRTLNC